MSAMTARALLAAAKIVGRLSIDRSTSQRGNYTAKDATLATIFRCSYHNPETKALAEKRTELLVSLVNREIDGPLMDGVREMYEACLSGDFYQDYDAAGAMLGRVRRALDAWDKRENDESFTPEILVEWEAMKGWQEGDIWSDYYTRWDRDIALRRAEAANAKR